MLSQVVCGGVKGQSVRYPGGEEAVEGATDDGSNGDGSDGVEGRHRRRIFRERGDDTKFLGVWKVFGLKAEAKEHG